MLFFTNFLITFWIFFGGFGALWVPLGSLLGALEALLGGLRTQKPSKTGGFLRFLKMQLFGSLKLLMALLGSSCPLFGRSGPKVGPKMVPKSGPKSDQKVGQKWHQKWSESPQTTWSTKGSINKKIALTAPFFQRLGLLKTLTWRCLKDSLKTVPKWFQNGSRLPKVLR